MKEYKAPWGMSLIIVSGFITLFAIAAAIIVLMSARQLPAVFAALPLLFVAIGALFTIRGYGVTSRALLVRRLFWTTRLPLAELQSATFQPGAMRWGIRLFGNGGLFSFTGLFYNKILGSFRAFVTNPRQIVVLRFRNRTVVVSPSRPQDFVRELGAMTHTAA